MTTIHSEINQDHKNTAFKLKRLTVATLVLLGSTLAPSVAHSAMITLDFTTYTNSIYNGYGSNWLTTPIVGDFKITLDTASLANTASTNAYNNTPNYTESVITSLTDGKAQTYQQPYSNNTATINQTYSHFPSTSQMSLGGSFQTQYSGHQVVSNNYTGNLPPELVPTTSNQATVFTNGSTQINWNNVLGTTPKFEVYNAASLNTLFGSMLGNTFNFYQNSSSYSCSTLDSTGNYCQGNQIQLGNNGSNGTAVLASVTGFSFAPASVSSVPVPGAVWLFGSGLAFLMARRKSTFNLISA